SIGDARVSVFTDSSDFPVVPATACNPPSVTTGCNPLQVSPGGGRDAFVARMVTTTTSTTTNTSTAGYLGGSGSDIGTSIALDGVLNTYVTGETSSNNFPPTSKALQTCSPSVLDALVIQVGIEITVRISPSY